ncbi:CAP domain-containing protein [Alsobacter sp. SYSU BS001988]
MDRIQKTRRLVAALAALGLAGCTTSESPAPSATPTFYQRLDQGGRLDEEAAVSMINAYRAKNGLGPLALDPGLVAEARRQAATVADNDTSTWGETPNVGVQKASVGGRSERVSAGYRTLAEAFSGWRDSPPHNRVLLAPSGARLGIAAVDRPGAKYRVYWDIIVSSGPS